MLQKTVEEYKQKCFDGAEHVAHMFAFFVRVDQRASAEVTNRLYPKTKSFSDWLKIHYEHVTSVFDVIPSPPIKTHGAI